jgi:hypothetical protein
MNGYEIRLEVLRLAHADCFNKYIETVNNIRLGNESSIPQEQIDGFFPKTEDIISRAKELYEFVETQNS